MAARWLDNSFDPDAEEIILREKGDKMPGRMNGESLELEAIAANILAAGRRGTTKHSELRDYLTSSQLDLRRSREVYPQQGYPEAHLFEGMYHRVHNPNTRGGHSSNSTPNLDNDEDHHG